MSWQLKLLKSILRIYVKPQMSRMKFHGRSLASARKRIEMLLKHLPMPPYAEIEPVTLDGVPGEWVRGKNRDGSLVESGRVVLYLHGGGYVSCSPRTHRSITTRLAKYADCRVLAIDYRLAPEHPYPAALEDSLMVYRWLLKNGYEAGQIVIAGDSAGGNLTMATLLTIRDSTLGMPAGAVCISPWVNMSRPEGDEWRNRDADPMLPSTRMAEIARVYLVGEDPFNPVVSPVLADLHGLPPLCIHTGTTEILFDDIKMLADNAHRDGVDVTFKAFDDTPHVIHGFAPIVPEGRSALDEVIDFCRSRFEGSAPLVSPDKRGKKSVRGKIDLRTR